jgi:hypothetical protein
MKSKAIIPVAAAFLLLASPLALAGETKQATADPATHACNKKAKEQKISKKDHQQFMKKCKAEQQASAPQGGGE